MTRIFLLSFFLFLSSASYSQKDSIQLNSPSDVDQLKSNPGDTLYYGIENQHYGILRLPKKSKRKNNRQKFPVLIVIHGGCWYSPYAQTRNTEAISEAFTDQLGLITWNIEYRQFDNGGGFPNTFLDIADAVDYVRILAKDYPVDTNNVLIYGHSAGGHLAIWSAARKNIQLNSELYDKNPLTIRHVIGVGAIADLVAFDEIEEETCGIVCVSKLMGGSLTDVPKHYRAANPTQLFPIGVPISLITGEFDKIVPKSHGDNFQFSARGRGDIINHYYIENVGHHEYNDPSSKAWSIISSVVKKKIKK